MNRLDVELYVPIHYIDDMPVEFWFEVLYNLLDDVERLVHALRDNVPLGSYSDWMQRLHLARKALDALSRQDGR